MNKLILPTLKTFLIGAFVLGILLFLPAFDHRFAWSPVSAPVSLLGDALVALGLMLNLIVMRENSYSSSTIEIMEEQKVISTGPYALVRHPMYAASLVMIVGVPLALGSWLGLAIIFLTIPVLVWRILDEERLLRTD